MQFYSVKTHQLNHYFMTNTATTTATKTVQVSKDNSNKQMQMIEIVFYALGVGYWISMFSSM